MGRRRFNPPDNVTAGEWDYLLSRYSEAEAEERRDRIRLALKRLVGKGRDPKQLHLALMNGAQGWEVHAAQRTRNSTRRRHDAAVVARARRDVDRAMASLRRVALLMFPDVDADGDNPLLAAMVKERQRIERMDDNDLFALRDFWLGPATEGPATEARRRRGRPSEAWKHDTDEALKQCGVGSSDRRELMAAFGFLDDE